MLLVRFLEALQTIILLFLHCSAPDETSKGFILMDTQVQTHQLMVFHLNTAEVFLKDLKGYGPREGEQALLRRTWLKLKKRRSAAGSMFEGVLQLQTTSSSRQETGGGVTPCWKQRTNVRHRVQAELQPQTNGPEYLDFSSVEQVSKTSHTLKEQQKVKNTNMKFNNLSLIKVQLDRHPSRRRSFSQVALKHQEMGDGVILEFSTSMLRLRLQRSERPPQPNGAINSRPVLKPHFKW